MAGGDGKTIRVRCATWDQVEAFYTEKLKGNILVVKMPFRPGIGEGMTVALGLPDGLVFAIDGTVMKIGGEEGGRVPVAVRLHGMTAEVRAQLKRLVGNARNAPVTPVQGTRALGTRPPSGAHRVMARGSVEAVPPPPEPRVDEVPDEGRGAWAQLIEQRERIAALPAHELLGVTEGAGPAERRRAFRVLALRYHPDRFRRTGSRSLVAVATEVLVALARAAGLPPRGDRPAGWLVALPDGSEPPGETGVAPPPAGGAGAPAAEVGAEISAPYSELEITSAATSSGSYDDDVSFTTSVRMRALNAEELFDDEAPAPPPAVTGPASLAARAQEVAVLPDPPPAATAPPPPPAAEASSSAIADPRAELEEAGRAALLDGRYREACEAFAAVLRLDPKNRQLRALYHVANGLDLRAKGEGVKARLQFETALAHDRDCEPARRALAPEADAAKKGGIFKRLFDKG
jgi:hypothetical protein